MKDKTGRVGNTAEGVLRALDVGESLLDERTKKGRERGDNKHQPGEDPESCFPQTSLEGRDAGSGRVPTIWRVHRSSMFIAEGLHRCI